ncbi:hypothetical protein [Streptomyces sp. NRRL S-350]|uniref:hypothetical protein n=1 Tax=Streptomyces sp. NRRL S-350 TaxID=1463902 RepID=UPI00131D8B72|nr:hypothetical protein [Streptomyces sp. NRRL S-350]
MSVTDNESAAARAFWAEGEQVVPALRIRPPENATEQALLGWMNMHITMEREANRPISGWAYRSVFELVLEHGRWFNPVSLPAAIPRGPERECFHNAAAIERAHPHLRYVEGFAIVTGSPVATAHAWCTDGDGNAIDPTWTELGEDTAYFGIPLAPTLRPNPRFSSGVLERPETLYPLLQDGLTAST